MGADRVSCGEAILVTRGVGFTSDSSLASVMRSLSLRYVNLSEKEKVLSMLPPFPSLLLSYGCSDPLLELDFLTRGERLGFVPGVVCKVSTLILRIRFDTVASDKSAEPES